MFSFALSAEAATDFITRFKKPMPKMEHISEKDFLASTELKEANPYGEKSLAHSIRIPTGWTKSDDSASSNFQISDKLLSKLAVYFAPPSIYGQERIEIKAVSLNFDMDAEQWFLQNLMATGRTTEGYINHDKRRVEALMLVMEGDVSYVLRTVAQINGSHVFVVEYYVPVDMWDVRAGLQEKVIQSFQMKTRVDESVVKLLPYQILDICQIRYPDYWEEKPDAMTSVERLGVKFYNFLYQNTDSNGKKSKPIIEGRMDVSLVANWASPSLLDEMDNFKKSVEINELLIGERISVVDDVEYYKTVTFGATEVYKVLSNADNAREYEFWFTFLLAGNYYYFVSLMTPSRNDDYSTWVKNTQSYKILVSNIQPSAETKK